MRHGRPAREAKSQTRPATQIGAVTGFIARIWPFTKPANDTSTILREVALRMNSSVGQAWRACQTRCGR